MPRNVVQRAERSIDLWLLASLLCLICIGLVMVYSASIADAYEYYGSPYYVVEREAVWVAIGIVAMIAAIRIPYRRWRSIALPFFGVSFALLVLVLVPGLGHASHGASRWFTFGAGVEIQPSEMIKLALVLYLGAWFTSKGEDVRDLKSTAAPFAFLTGAIALLLIEEPDLGTAIVISATMMAIYFVAGARIQHLLVFAAGGGLVGYFLLHQHSYRSGRLLAFMNPWKDPTGAGYHTIQALLALGSGGLFGLGLGNSNQKYVLPAPHTDSILAIIGEEWGLLGTIAVLLLFMIVAYRGMRIAMTAPDNFGRLVAAGVTAWVVFQALLNYAVITSSVPFTGVPLPFISYGGTSLILSMAAVGIVLNISRHATGEGVLGEGSRHGRGKRRSRVSGTGSRPEPAATRVRPGRPVES
jgi:cell division protein FtsW